MTQDGCCRAAGIVLEEPIHALCQIENLSRDQGRRGVCNLGFLESRIPDSRLPNPSFGFMLESIHQGFVFGLIEGSAVDFAGGICRKELLLIHSEGILSFATAGGLITTNGSIKMGVVMFASLSDGTLSGCDLLCFGPRQR